MDFAPDPMEKFRLRVNEFVQRFAENALDAGAGRMKNVTPNILPELQIFVAAAYFRKIMPYSKQIEELRVAHAKSAQLYLEASISNSDARRNRLSRDEKLLYQAETCNAALSRIKYTAGQGDVAQVVDGVLSSSSLTMPEMEAILQFGPEWGKLLTNGPKPSTLYQLEITNRRDGEVYYKVGHTSGSIQSRINGLGICKRTFSVNVHHMIQFREKWCAEAEEKRLHARNEPLRYVGPPIMSNGHTEVYTQPLLSHGLKLELCLYSLLGIARY